MSIKFALQAKTRSVVGTSEVRRLRLAGSVPVVIYGAGKDSLNLSMDHNEVFLAMKKPGFSSSLLDLSVDGKKAIKVILKSKQVHVINSKVMHLDFQYVSSKESINVNVPLEFINQVKNKAIKSGAMLSVNKNEVEVACLPANLPEKITVDVGSLALDQTIHQSDLTLPTGVELVGNVDDCHDLPIASIHKNKASAVEEEVEAPVVSDAPEKKSS